MIIRKWWSALGKPTQEPEIDPDVIRRAEQADRIINDPLVIEAFEIIETEFTRLIIESSETDEEGRERAYRMLWSARRFKSFFESVVASGKIRQHQLEQFKNGQP